MSEHIEYIVHENGINEIILHADDREVVDEYMNTIEKLIVQEIEDDSITIVRLLVNLTQTRNIPPFAYITKKGRRMLHEHFRDRDKIHLRGVMLARHDEMTIASLAETFIKLLPIDAQMKPFEGNQREEAIAWLLSDN